MSAHGTAEQNAKTVLLVGSGGREHALALKLSASKRCGKLIVLPGNDGMSAAWERWKMPLGSKADFEAIADRARDARVDLVVIGPDNPLADGVVDVLEARGLKCFGPDSRAAQIEASKSFAKEIMFAAKVPTAAYSVARSLKEASEKIETLPWGSGWVLKADGLALGKGVFVCATLDEAHIALEQLKNQGHEKKIIIEERLQGEELSWFAFCDGESCALLDPARDYKRVGNYNEGPNTGGMGAISPVPGVTDALRERVRREVFEPTLAEMKKRGVPFRGLLYAGLMVDLKREKLWVIEFNCRFGDPETQVLLARMSDDLLDWIEASVEGKLKVRPKNVGFIRDAAVIVVAASAGYPDQPEKGQEIKGALSSSVIAAGVARSADGKLHTSGGRVFGVLGLGSTLEMARKNAYSELSKLSFNGMQFRRDIGETKTLIVVMASGQGTGFEAIVQATLEGKLNVEIVALISDKTDAPVLAKAKRLGIPTHIVPFEKGDERLLAKIRELGPRFLVLSGYMRVVSRQLIEAFRSERGYSRILNIHPALLPSFPGLHGYRQAYEYGVKLAGATVHLVEEAVDQGPICAQEAFSIEGLTLEDIQEKGKLMEQRLYRDALRWILPENFSVEKMKGRICVRPN